MSGWAPKESALHGTEEFVIKMLEELKRGSKGTARDAGEGAPGP
jgi:hypothetical protein